MTKILFIENNDLSHCEIIESIIVKYEIIIKNKVDLIYLSIKKSKNFKNNKNFENYIKNKYPKIILGIPKIYNYFINCTIYEKDYNLIKNKNPNTHFYISHRVYDKYEKMKNVYCLTPLSKQYIYSDILPFSNLKKQKTEYPIFCIQGVINKKRRYYKLLDLLLNHKTQYKFKIKIIGMGKLLPELIKYKDKIILKSNLDFIDYHKEFLDCHCLLPLITKNTNKNYYDNQLTSSINYVKGYGLKCLIDKDLQDIYNLPDVEIFNNENDICNKFEKILKDFYKVKSKFDSVCIKGCFDKKINGIYKLSYLSNIDIYTNSFYKDNKYQLYRYNNKWRIAEYGKKVYFELPHCEGEKWNINELDLTYFMNFNVWMIVYENDSNRLDNYKKINKIINCEKFNAIDTIKNFYKYSKFSLENNYTTTEYINKYINLPGKLGCNLSHQILLEEILKNSSTDWNLILEDDIDIHNYNKNDIQNLLNIATLNKSNFIQLYTNDKFLEKQKKQKRISNNLYKMIPQWHTTAYFINKSGINTLKNNYPIIKNIDIQFSLLINELNSLCFINSIFNNKGNKTSFLEKSKFGSLIWDNKKNITEIDDIISFLNIKYSNKKIIYCPNPGNGGDRLIANGTLEVFNKANLNWEFFNSKKIYKNSILFYAGGGNFVGLYNDCKKFINSYKKNNELVILPHTIKDEDSLISSLGNNVSFFCRERKSFEYVKKVFKYKKNVYLSKDLAFYIPKSIIDKYICNGKGTCNLFRLDIEKTNIQIPSDNIDLSLEVLPKGKNRWKCDDIKDISEISNKIFKFISKYETINTNRLHIAIASALIGKKVNLYKNSYYKNKEVYEYSIKKKYCNIKFI